MYEYISRCADKTDLYDMHVNDLAYLWNATYEVLRVPGGWMYTHRTNDGQPSSCFVPFDNEFQPKPPSDLAF